MVLARFDAADAVENIADLRYCYGLGGRKNVDNCQTRVHRSIRRLLTVPSFCLVARTGLRSRMTTDLDFTNSESFTILVGW